MIFLKKNYKKIPRNKKTRKSSRFFNRFIVHRFKAPLGNITFPTTTTNHRDGIKRLCERVSCDLDFDRNISSISIKKVKKI